MWRKIRSGVMFGIACITSPCCTPLIVPLLLSLLAGTPVALWMGQNLGWVYGILTAISILSLVLALRSMSRRNTTRKSQTITVRPSDIPVISRIAGVGDKAHVE
jgi:hypothetical protein